MSSLFDDLSLPDAFRRLDGVQVTPSTSPHEEPPRERKNLHLSTRSRPRGGAPYDELPPSTTARCPSRPGPARRAGGPGLDELVTVNPAQREARRAPRQPLLIVAGAGSKTRCHSAASPTCCAPGRRCPARSSRSPSTNKAAAEMRERVEELVAPPRAMWVSTFHSACVRILRDAQPV